MDKVANSIKEKIANFQGCYGVLGWIAVALVVCKVFLFYHLVNIASYYILISLITCTFILLLFVFFKNKWIPAIIYFLISTLMFANVTYNSFFNKYLSVNMFSAAGMLGDVMESVKDVLQPTFFLMFLDAIFIIVMLIVARKKKQNLKGSYTIKI